MTLTDRERRLIARLEEASSDDLLGLVARVDRPAHRESHCLFPSMLDGLDLKRLLAPRFDRGPVPTVATHGYDRELERAHKDETRLHVDTVLYELVADPAAVVHTAVTEMGYDDRWRSYEQVVAEFVWVCDRSAKKVSRYTRKTRARLERTLLLTSF